MQRRPANLGLRRLVHDWEAVDLPRKEAKGGFTWWLFRFGGSDLGDSDPRVLAEGAGDEG